MRSMLTLLELIFAIFLEKKTTKTSKNSSMTPSQTDKDESALDQPRSNTKGKKEQRQAAHNSRTVETVSVATVTLCDICGENLTDAVCHQHERRTKIDITFEKTVEHVDAKIKKCPSCLSTTKAKFPTDLYGPLQYGNGLKAYAINMLVYQMVALNLVQKCIISMIGQVISEASILKFVLRLYQTLVLWENHAIETLLQSSALNVDETSLRVNKTNHWIHVYAAGDITVKRLHRRRGLEAINEINIIPRY